MEALKAEIERKRKASDALRGTVGGELGTSKFIRQGEYQMQRDRQHEDAQRKLDEERLQKTVNVVPSSSSSSVSLDVVALQASRSAEPSAEHASMFASLSEIEVKQRLRELGLPVTHFGEGAKERLLRLVDSVTAVAEASKVREDESATAADHPSGDDQGGTVGEQEEDVDDDDDDDDDDGEVKGVKSSRGVASGGGSEGGAPVLYSLLPNLSKEKAVYKFFRSLLKIWGHELGMRDTTEKITASGKLETKAHKQCKDHIKPMLKMCKKKTLQPDILGKLFDIVKSCEEGNFREAHDHYYMAAIGNAAWPIGVTSVGIHDRSGRERIGTAKTAHIMNNELQRKYLTSVKRLLTFAQLKRPDVPPSMKVL